MITDFKINEQFDNLITKARLKFNEAIHDIERSDLTNIEYDRQVKIITKILDSDRKKAFALLKLLVL